MLAHIGVIVQVYISGTFAFLLFSMFSLIMLAMMPLSSGDRLKASVALSPPRMYQVNLYSSCFNCLHSFSSSVKYVLN